MILLKEISAVKSNIRISNSTIEPYTAMVIYGTNLNDRVVVIKFFLSATIVAPGKFNETMNVIHVFALTRIIYNLIKSIRSLSLSLLNKFQLYLPILCSPPFQRLFLALLFNSLHFCAHPNILDVREET